MYVCTYEGDSSTTQEPLIPTIVFWTYRLQYLFMFAQIYLDTWLP